MMKTLINRLFLLCLASLVIPACNKDNNCGNGLSVAKIEPSANPPGYEIRLVGNGFTNQSVVRFDNAESSATRLVDGSTLIATVPAGVLGPVEVTVSDGNCIARNDRFEIFADFPNNVPFSPATIILPQAAINYPVNDFTNAWENPFDLAHSIFLEDIGDANGVLGSNSKEFDFNNIFFDNNPITGYFRFDETARTSDVRVEIDRSQQQGGDVEVYTGGLIDPASVGLTSQYVLLLTSQKDGRQLIFEFN